MKKFIVKFGHFELGFFPDENLETSSQEEDVKFLSEKKEDILKLLRENPAVTKIEPLEQDVEIKRLFSHSYFGEPIKFRIKLPFKNQEITQKFFHYDSKLQQTIEEFNVLFDGWTFAVYQEIEPSTLDFLGAADLRDEIYNIFKVTFPNIRIIPPTPFKQNFVYLVSYPEGYLIEREKEFHGVDFVFELDKVDFEKEIYSIFDYLELYLGSIYDVYYSHVKINDIAKKIIETQEKLSPHYKNLINSNFLANFLNYNTKKSIKILTHDLSKLIIDYVSALNMHEQNLSQAIFYISDSPLKDFSKELRNDTGDYIKIDVDILYRYIESITTEINTRSMNYSTITAGIIGGVIGAVGTIIVTLMNKP